MLNDLQKMRLFLIRRRGFAANIAKLPELLREA